MADEIKVAYRCDGRACGAECSEKEGVYCQYTTDVSHARNFIRIGDTYMEKEFNERRYCAYCKHKDKEQLTDEKGFTFYRWFCELSGGKIEATGTCEGWEPNG